MPLLYYIQTSAIGLVITGVIYIHVYTRKAYSSATQKLFQLLLLSNMALLLLEMLLSIFTGVDSVFARLALPVIVCVIYVMNPVPQALWVLYLDSLTRRGEPHKNNRMTILIATPVAVNIVFCVLSLFSGYLFTIDAQNVYHRGEYFWVMALLSYSYMAYYVYLVLRKRQFLRRHESAPLLLAALPPIVASILQSLFFGIAILWLSVSLSLLIIYTSVQSSQVYTDHLTGIANRRNFDAVLLHFFSKHKKVGGMMIDIDGFKKINDVYGHDMGDRVLESVGGLLKKSLRRNDFVARIGGDEFAVLIEADSSNQLDKAANRIHAVIEEFNSVSAYPFDLSLSIGYTLWSPASDGTQEQFVRDMDAKMYLVKNAQASA
jgi:diguanylate cyclase (GGDEF)-like protein